MHMYTWFCLAAGKEFSKFYFPEVPFHPGHWAWVKSYSKEINAQTTIQTASQ